MYFSDTAIADQVWKEQIDLQVFTKLMDLCSDSNNTEYKMRYVKIMNEENDESTSSDTIVDESKIETSGNKDVSTADQIFLETTV